MGSEPSSCSKPCKLSPQHERAQPCQSHDSGNHVKKTGGDRGSCDCNVDIGFAKRGGISSDKSGLVGTLPKSEACLKNGAIGDAPRNEIVSTTAPDVPNRVASESAMVLSIPAS